MKRSVLGIDPGPAKTAWVELSSREEIMFGLYDNDELVAYLKGGLVSKDTDVVIEMIASYGMPVGQTTFETCVFIGRVTQICLDAGAVVKYAYRKKIVTWLCGSAKAKDANVRQALIDKYGEQGTKNNRGATYGISKDVWSALAVATYYNEGGYEQDNKL